MVAGFLLTWPRAFPILSLSLSGQLPIIALFRSGMMFFLCNRSVKGSNVFQLISGLTEEIDIFDIFVGKRSLQSPCIANISLKNTLRPGTSCTPSPPDGPGAYNVNSSSGCICPGTWLQGTTMLHRAATGAFRCTNPSNRTPREILFLLTAPNGPGRTTTSLQCR